MAEWVIKQMYQKQPCLGISFFNPSLTCWSGVLNVKYAVSSLIFDYMLTKCTPFITFMDDYYDSYIEFTKC